MKYKKKQTKNFEKLPIRIPIGKPTTDMGSKKTYNRKVKHQRGYEYAE